MRRSLILVVAAALVFAACTSGDDSKDVGSGGTGGDAPSTTLDPQEVAKAPGVTDDSIKVGVTFVDEAAIKASGLEIRLGEYKKSYETLIDEINANGGINGRKIDLVIRPINPVGTAPADKVCLELTEDEKVFVAVGFFLNDAVLCPVETHDTAVIGGSQTSERLSRAKAPWFTPTPGAEMPKTVVRKMKDQGLLDGKVAVFAGAGDQDLLSNEIEPLLDELGVKPVEVGQVSAEQGDATAIESEVNVIAQKFKSAGADSVLLVGPNAANWYATMEKNPYQPKLLITDTSSVQAFLSNAATTDTSLLKGAVQGGPYGPNQKIFDEENMQACMAKLEKAGIEIPEPDPTDANEQGFQGPWDVCVNVTLLEAILEKAGKDLNYATFRQAGNTLGKVQIPGDPTPRTYGPPPASDGTPTAYLSTFDASTEAFVPES